MAIKSLSLDSVRVFESSHDPDKGTENATKWKIGNLDSRIAGRVRDAATTVSVDQNAQDDEVETNINTNEAYFQTCMYGLKGWENFLDNKGNHVAYKTVKRRHGGVSYDVVDPEILMTIPQVVLTELASEILKDNNLSAAEGNG